jgi:small redox-active disulfide protein 2
VKVEVLGTGCAKCEKLAANAKKAVADLGIDAQVEKVSDLDIIASYGVMMTPALVIDGQVKTAGRVPDASDIGRMIVAATEVGGSD